MCLAKSDGTQANCALVDTKTSSVFHGNHRECDNKLIDS